MNSKHLSLIDRGSRRGSIIIRNITSFMRILPRFIIIGVGRGGTTSLYNYLTAHPSVMPSLWKEIGFFDQNFHKGINWYKSHFPLNLTKYHIEKKFRKDFTTGEATPVYIYHPDVSLRIKKIIPNVKLIVLLRNPVDRAYSQFHNAIEHDREKRSFEEAVDEQIKEREKIEEENLLNNSKNYRKIYHSKAYLSTGIYIDQIKPWFEIFSKNQILVIKSEDMYADPLSIVNKTLEFLDLPKWDLREFKKYNFHGYEEEMQTETRKRLIEFFKPHNEKLYDYLGRNFNWEK